MGDHFNLTGAINRYGRVLKLLLSCRLLADMEHLHLSALGAKGTELSILSRDIFALHIFED